MMLACTVLIAVALSAMADAQTVSGNPPAFFVYTGGSEANPQMLVTSNYTVTIGSNVTLGCAYNQTQNWWTTIGKYSVDGKVVIPLYENGFATDSFIDVMTQYPAIDARVDGSSYLGTSLTITYLKLINVQPYDLGAYACYSRLGTKQRTPYANLTLVANIGDLFGVRSIAMDQQMEIAPNTTISTYTCSVYRAQNAAVQYFAYFDKCTWSGRGDDTGATRTTSCIGKASVWSTASRSQLTFGVVNVTGAPVTENINSDMYPLVGTYAGNIFWQKSVARDTYTLTLTAKDIYANWLNQSLGCFAYKNGSSIFSDYMTFVAPGVDLNLDPTVFACGRHHFVASSGLVNFTCVVTQPSYRTAAVYTWELWIPSKTSSNVYTTSQVATQADLDAQGYGKNVKLTQTAVTTTVNVTSLATPQQQTRTTLSVMAGTEQANWRYRLLATYPDGSIQRSDYFSIASSIGTGVGGSGALPGPQTGKAISGGANALTAWSMLLSVFTCVAFLFARL